MRSISTTRVDGAITISAMKIPRADRGPVPLSGYLHKMKATERVLTPQWNRRYFALEGRELKYYTNESSLEPSKVIDLLEIESIRRFENGDHGVFSFVLKTPERNYFLRADSKGDMKRWVRGLKEQQDLWRLKQQKGSVRPDPAQRRPKHYADIPLRGAPLLSSRSSDSLLAECPTS